MNKDNSQVKRKNKFNSSTSLKNISCLVSGFGPFNEAYYNPSASIALAMPSQLVSKKNNVKVSIKSVVLPVAGEEVWPALKPMIDALPAKQESIIVMIGQAANRKVIGLERFALNFREYKIKDNAEKMFSAEAIVKNAPDAIKTKIPIEGALSYLLKKGAIVETSNHAGTFVCNEAYFHALHYINRRKLPHVIYFVHVPLPKTYGQILAKSKMMRWSKLSSGKENQLAAMTEVIKLLIEFSAEMISKK